MVGHASTVPDLGPSQRHVVRLITATPTEDPLTRVRIWQIEWHRDDALPFDGVATPNPR